MKTHILSLILSLGLLSGSQAAIIFNEIYSGGGSSTGSPAYLTDFIELINTGSSVVDISGYRVDYGSSAQTAGNFPTPVGVLPTGSLIQPGGFFLIQTGGSGTAGAADVTPDVDYAFVNGVSGASLSNASGGLRLQDSSLAILDVVGWGTTNNFEGTAETTPTSTAISMQRTLGIDTNNNASDFTQSTPTPTASAVPEPSRALLMLAGLTGLFLRRKRA
jgi:predicted extracellular nuclease